MPPEEIQDRTQIRVVLFKEALTTGWDCPRAEVMLSFRKTTDFTYIAQLVGRMVRTPLARRINTDERLNEVTLILPHYDEETVEKVVDQLKSDPEAPPTYPKVNPVSLSRNTALRKEVFDKLLSLPTYTVPGVVHRSQVARLNALAVRLSGDDIEPDAVKTASNTLNSTLNAERTRLGSALDDTVKGLGVIDVMGVKYKLADETSTATPTQVAVAPQDIESLFTDAKRKLRDGLAHDYWSHLLELEDAKPEDERMTPEDVKLVVCALANDLATVNTVEVSAENLIQTWLKQHSRDIANLKDSARAAYSQIRATAKNPELDSLSLPDAISVSSKKNATEIEKHIFADSNHKYPTVFKSSWEKDVVDAELAAGAVAWYQNPVGGGRAIRVAYKEGKRYRALYPDFVFFDEGDDGELRASIVDPHDYTRSDTGPKWRALADYAAEHASEFHRVDAVIKDGDKLLRIDLLDEPTRDALQAAGDSKDAILDVFKQFGGDFVANLAP